ncbi:hypothetical protein [Erythrobacter sp. HL-111]|nr:hypothetical protein [Erythrobacter sp. HL-111]KPP91475.1 MAG: hypothetical protein HLUCCO15_08055 [Erythrobacteraceae bacterium HL-111]SDS25749.1 hypothetical protein SAMN04515621_1240 [Erythrobacter sp. HL-111]
MYSFFDQAGQRTRRVLAAAGALVITVVLATAAILPAGPSYPFVTGVLA